MGGAIENVVMVASPAIFYEGVHAIESLFIIFIFLCIEFQCLLMIT